MPAGRKFRNWLGNVAFTPAGYYQPADEGEVVALVQRARREGRQLRVIGGGHSWSAGIATDGYLLSLDRLAQIVRIDPGRQQVTVQAGIRLRELSAQLHRHGLALLNLGSIQEQSLAGAIQTGTHGTGLQFGILATQVRALRLVTGSGEVLTCSVEKDGELLEAARVSLGALGVITEVTLQVAPAFNLREERTPLPFAEALALVPQRLTEADHIKLWWLPHGGRVQVYRQYRTQEPVRARRGLLSEDTRSAQEVFGALLALGSALPPLVPPIQRFLSRVQFTASSHVGPSFRVFSVAMPPRHHESEYAVPLPRAAATIQALHDLIVTRRHCVHFILEFRFVQKDAAWLSPAYGSDVCFVGAYDANRRGWPAFRRDYEELMQRCAGRPHWGKEFTARPEYLRAAYPRWDDFLRLRQQLDPAGVFVNRHLQEVLGLGP